MIQSAANGCAPGRSGSGSRARTPGRFQDLADQRALLRDVLDERVEPHGHQAASRLHHVLDELSRIAGQRVELDPRSLDHLPELGMCGEPDPVTLGELPADGEKWLHVAARADDEDDHREAWNVGYTAMSPRHPDVGCVVRDPRIDVGEDVGGIVEIHPESFVGLGRESANGSHGRETHPLAMHAATQERLRRRADETLSDLLAHAETTRWATSRNKLQRRARRFGATMSWISVLFRIRPWYGTCE